MATNQHAGRRPIRESGDPAPLFLPFLLSSCQYRLPKIRELKLSAKITDDHTLLLAMLASEKAITGETWKAAFSIVNLNPDTEMPIEVWLSKLSEQLVASGESERLMNSGYNPTDEEVMLEHGKIHLRAIKVPPLYDALEPATQKEVLAYYSAPEFDWGQEVVLNSPFAADLRLATGNNLKLVFKFVMAMQEAVRLGVADEGAPVPDWSLPRLRNSQLEKARAQRAQATPSHGDIGGSGDTQLASYSVSKMPEESDLETLARRGKSPDGGNGRQQRLG